MPWVVKVISQPQFWDFREDYFPRKVAYKKYALELQNEVERKGGRAVIEKMKR